MDANKYGEWCGVFNHLNEFLFEGYTLLNQEPPSYEEFNDLVNKTFGNDGVLEISLAPMMNCSIKIGLDDIIVQMMERYSIPEEE